MAPKTSSSGAGRLPMGAVKYSLTKTDPPRVSDQAQRFVLLTYLLRRVGMCSPDISTCLARYIKTLPVVKLGQLKEHFPHCEAKIVHDATFLMPTTLNGLVTLGDPAVLTPTALADLLRAALLHFTESPSWAYGVNGFFLWTATKASRIPLKGAPRSSGPTTGFWLGELENAVWVAAVSRAIVLTHGNKTPIPVLTRQALREGFYTLFNMTKDAKHFAESCVCEDKVFAFDHESYHVDIYEENVLPLPADDDDDLELRKTAIKRIEVNLVETLDRLVWPEMDREAAAEAARRDSKRPKGAVPTEPVDHSFSAAGIASLYEGKQRPFSSRIVDAHWVMATPMLEKAEEDAAKFAGKIRRGCHIMAFDPCAGWR